jgi:hypothetical protein
VDFKYPVPYPFKWFFFMRTITALHDNHYPCITFIFFLFKQKQKKRAFSRTKKNKMLKILLKSFLFCRDDNKFLTIRINYYSVHELKKKRGKKWFKLVPFSGIFARFNSFNNWNLWSYYIFNIFFFFCFLSKLLC